MRASSIVKLDSTGELAGLSLPDARIFPDPSGRTPREVESFCNLITLTRPRCGGWAVPDPAERGVTASPPYCAAACFSKSPVWYASTTAWTRSRRPSFWRLCVTCVFTVVSLM